MVIKKLKNHLEERKREGIEVTLKENVQAKNSTTLLEDIILIHNALPEMNFDELDISTNFLNHKFSAPFIIDAMTGGTKEAAKINANLASAAEELGIGMGLGSQRAGLNSINTAETYAIARKKAPSAFLIANIGGAQLIDGLSLKKIKKIIEMINADAIAIHLNPLQEMIQPEGEPKYKGVLDKISWISSEINVPVIVKETGCGISKEVAIKLEIAGVSAVNVAGLGGTSWAAVEHFRAEKRKMHNKAELGKLFWNWGIPTAVSLIEAKSSINIPIIASGGIRTGLDIAKCISLGASLVGTAQPLLSPAVKSSKEVITAIDKMIYEFKTSMFVTGSRTVSDLTNSRHIITGKLLEWQMAH
ncbi:MAG: type 2 isopentenyl-diphosphate Delta-isomerase [Nitrososphaerales archaeon]|jgi:isopentenyl-diphosphate delta-isomerase|nr:type 2 isopentenyl-diphosphate Delta-isomerase [Nitrososphaerales archaeon]|tara:strand:+ start:4303 stop:5382 length:1080 start_codon:yes stop_codon:yes gene_type:complete